MPTALSKRIQPARMKKDERVLQDLLICMDEFEAYPFDSTLPYRREIQLDLQNALDEGKKQADNILEKRRGFFEKNYLWVVQYQNYNWLNLASTPVTTLAWSSCNIAEVRKIRLAASMNLVHHGSLFQRRVTKECLTMFNIDESLWKTA